MHGGVLAIAAGTQMGGDPLALGEDLDGSLRQADLDSIAGDSTLFARGEPQFRPRRHVSPYQAARELHLPQPAAQSPPLRTAL